MTIDSRKWNDIKGSAFALVCRIIDNFEHNCDLYRVPKKGYTFNNVTAVNHTPKIKDVIFNDPATIVFWNDGTKTVVQTRDGDEFDPEKGLAMAIAKKSLGNKYEYYNVFKHWLKKAPRPVNLDVNVSVALNNFAESAAQASSCIAAITEAFSSKKNRRLF